MSECAICFEPLSNTSTRVITECCNNMIHLECYNKCSGKCPFCRHETSVDIPLIGTPEQVPRHKHICYDVVYVVSVISIMGWFVYELTRP